VRPRRDLARWLTQEFILYLMADFPRHTHYMILHPNLDMTEGGKATPTKPEQTLTRNLTKRAEPSQEEP